MNKKKSMSKLTIKSSILRYAIASRILILTLIILWRSLLSPYDTSASLNPNCLSSSTTKTSSSNLKSLDSAVRFPEIGFAIERSVVWDSVYFLRIAQCGYEYEQIYAFLPLLPALIFLVSNSVFRPLIPLIGYRAVLALSGYAINNVAFVLAALYFYRLSIAILKDRDASLRASILFCFNPASIFYSSIYTESLYALFSIGGIYYLVSGANNTSVLLLALSGCARSNGVVNAGYHGFKMLHQAYHAVYVKKRFFLALRVVLAGAFRCICICIPFFAFQAYGYYNLCHGRSLDEMRPWCSSKVPLLYSFIQSRYWGVGFLRYFQLKQTPNFLLASPVLSLAFCSIFTYSKFDPERFFSLGFRTPPKEHDSTDELFSKGEEEHMFDDDHLPTKQDMPHLRRRQQLKTEPREESSSAVKTEMSTAKERGYYTTQMLPFMYHLSFLSLTALFVMYVQVSTRFLSASPPIYWYASYLTGRVGRVRWAYLIWAYAASYILLGSLLFSNFYPFT